LNEEIKGIKNEWYLIGQYAEKGQTLPLFFCLSLICVSPPTEYKFYDRSQSVTAKRLQTIAVGKRSATCG
jgi:hypothetical protein